MEDIARYANKVLVMNKGRIEMFDSVDNVFSKAERLIEIGLEVPQITHIFMKLRTKGFNIPQNVYSVEQGRDVLLKAFKKKGLINAD
jgi:energy-coupling factor transport system ATP-binding protein